MLEKYYFYNRSLRFL